MFLFVVEVPTPGTCDFPRISHVGPTGGSPSLTKQLQGWVQGEVLEPPWEMHGKSIGKSEIHGFFGGKSMDESLPPMKQYKISSKKGAADSWIDPISLFHLDSFGVLLFTVTFGRWDSHGFSIDWFKTTKLLETGETRLQFDANRRRSWSVQPTLGW